MSVFTQLEPQTVWKYFEEILKVPRPSGKEEKIAQYIIDFAKRENLEYKQDKTGNIIIRKPAAKGKENFKSVVLQSHMDMVCEKNADVQHNFETDPITALEKNGWITADGTTLGADDGIGIAAQLAILSDKTIEHGPLECLITVEEETGLTGAANLEPGFIQSDILINLDSEEEGYLYIGCAGGIDTIATFKCKDKEVKGTGIAMKLSVTGLLGGHSGSDIDRGLGNSIKIISRILWHCKKKFNADISTLEGGNLRNAIPREAFATVVISEADESAFTSLVQKISEEIAFELKDTESGLKIELEKTKMPKTILKNKLQKRLINALLVCPHGIMAMSKAMPGLVETSTNLASIKFSGRNTIKIVTSQRSSVASSKQHIANQTGCLFGMAKAQIEHTDSYPGWNPNVNSEILEISKSAYKTLFNIEPEVKAIHAGLECGLIKEKEPKLDMISFGPTLEGVHSPDERIEINSVIKFWQLLIKVLENVPEKN